MDEALGGVGGAGQGEAVPIGFGSAGLAPSSRDRNEIEALKTEMERLKKSLDGHRLGEKTLSVPIEGSEGAGVNIHTHSRGYLISWAHCGQKAMKKSPKARFCSTRCRISSWNGRHPEWENPLHFGK
ncbi:MAG: hypothetical protein AAF587_02285 [Bacteroidota bacterium]